MHGDVLNVAPSREVRRLYYHRHFLNASIISYRFSDFIFLKAYFTTAKYKAVTAFALIRTYPCSRGCRSKEFLQGLRPEVY